MRASHAAFDTLHRRWGHRAVTHGGRVLVGLLLVDLVFIVLHVFYDPTAAGLSGDVRVRLDKDRGYSEIFGYAQLLVAAVGLWVVHRRSRAPVHAAWAFVLVILVLDDAGAFHERLGNRVASLGLGQAIGELVVFGAVGLVLLGLVVVCHRRSLAIARADSTVLLLLLGGLVLVGVVFDLVHRSLSGPLSDVATVAEDGSELILMSVIAAFTGVVLATTGTTFRATRAATPYLSDRRTRP